MAESAVIVCRCEAETFHYLTQEDSMDYNIFIDFEDCVQYMIGKNSRADFIITVNKGDFEGALLRVRTPDEWLKEVGM